MTDELNTSEEAPPNVEFVCSTCRGDVRITGGRPVGVVRDYEKATCFVWVRKLRAYDQPGAPTYAHDGLTEQELLRWFIPSPRCRRHVARHHWPPIPYDRGKVLAWKALDEEKRSLIIVKGILDS